MLIINLLLSIVILQSAEASQDIRKIEKLFAETPFVTKDEKLINLPKGEKIIFFWASWCEICKNITPYWLDKAKTLEFQNSLFFINVDENNSLWQKNKSQINPNQNLFPNIKNKKDLMIIEKLPLVYVFGKKDNIEAIYAVWNERTSRLPINRFVNIKRIK